MVPTTELDADAILARRVARGEEGALEEVHDRLGGIVYGLAVRSLGDPSVAGGRRSGCWWRRWPPPVAVIPVLALGRGQTGSAPRATLTPGNAGGQTHAW